MNAHAHVTNIKTNRKRIMMIKNTYTATPLLSADARHGPVFLTPGTQHIISREYYVSLSQQTCIRIRTVSAYVLDSPGNPTESTSPVAASLRIQT